MMRFIKQFQPQPEKTRIFNIPPDQSNHVFFSPAEVLHRSAVFEFDLRQFKRHTDDWQKAFLKVFWTAKEKKGENKGAA